MFVTTHVLAGAALGVATRRPLVALLAGAVSHLAMDAVPHWGGVPSTVFLAVAVVDGLVGLAAVALLTGTAPRRLRLALLAGISGAALPDLDKPAVLFTGVDPFPAWFRDLHGAVQHEAPGFWWVEVAAAGLLAAAVAALVVRVRSRATTPEGQT